MSKTSLVRLCRKRGIASCGKSNVLSFFVALVAIVRLDVLQWSRTRMKWRNSSLIGVRHITPLVPSSSTRNRSKVTEFDAMRPSGTRSDFEQSSTAGRTSSCRIRTGLIIQPNYGSQSPCFRRISVLHMAACTAVHYQVRINNVHISVAVNGRFPDEPSSVDGHINFKLGAVGKIHRK